MFYHESGGAFLIRGIFRSIRTKEKGGNEARTFASIAYRKRGGSRFDTKDGSQTAESGSITYIPVGCAFFRDSPDEELIVLHLSAIGETDGALRVINGMDTTERLFEDMADEWANKTDGYENRCAAMLHTVFAAIEKSILITHPKLALIKDGVSLIGRRCCEASFSVTEAASVCHLSDVYFRKIYREIYGVTPVHALLTMRLERAKVYLQSGRYTVSETASLSGFSDVKYFSTAFKTHVGMTPSEYLNIR